MNLKIKVKVMTDANADGLIDKQTDEWIAVKQDPYIMQC